MLPCQYSVRPGLLNLCNLTSGARKLPFWCPERTKSACCAPKTAFLGHDPFVAVSRTENNSPLLGKTGVFAHPEPEIWLRRARQEPAWNNNTVLPRRYWRLKCFGSMRNDGFYLRPSVRDTAAGVNGIRRLQRGRCGGLWGRPSSRPAVARTDSLFLLPGLPSSPLLPLLIPGLGSCPASPGVHSVGNDCFSCP